MSSNDDFFINFDAKELSEADLVRLLEYHNRCYWEKGEQEISDDRYDELLRALEKINPDHPLVMAVHAPVVAGSGKVTHVRPMLSLNKAYSLDEVLEWAGKYVRSEDEPLLIQPKYDGISANFASGVLATRGDGETGEDISDKIPLIELEAGDYKGALNRPVRGEIVIRDDDFKTIYSHIVRKGGGAYKNSRNAVAGIMGLKDIADMLRQRAKLTLVDYEMFSKSIPFKELRMKWPEIVAEIEALPYPMDGIVIKLEDSVYSDSLGNTAHHPRGQIAFKFSGIRRESALLNVQWSFGKNCLTPVAEIEPVDIGGITIRHASLHNAQNIIDRDIHIGDTVTVERAGDVIPYIVSARPGDNRKVALIERCPCCDTVLQRSGPELCCLNPDCFETRVQRLAASVRNIGIERLGEPNIRRMMQALGVRTLKDIFNLSMIDILKLEGFKEKSASNLLREIAAARSVNDFQVLAALNIPNIGVNVAKAILTGYTIQELRGLSIEKLSEINGIGPERAGAISRELASQKDFLDELLECVDVKQTKGISSANLPKICFTGKMPEQRSYYEGLARQKGYDPVEAVTQELSLLVAADINASGGKLDKARKANIQIIAMDDWLKSASAAPALVSEPAPVSEPVASPAASSDASSTGIPKEQGFFDF